MMFQFLITYLCFLCFPLFSFCAYGDQVAHPIKAAKLSLLSGLEASRLAERIAAENLTNMHSTANTPGGDPYRNKILYTKAEKDPKTGATVLKHKVIDDPSPFIEEHDPYHPGAHPETGIVKKPNTQLPIVMANMHENALHNTAQVEMIQHLHTMEKETIDLLKSS